MENKYDLADEGQKNPIYGMKNLGRIMRNAALVAGGLALLAGCGHLKTSKKDEKFSGKTSLGFTYKLNRERSYVSCGKIINTGERYVSSRFDKDHDGYITRDDMEHYTNSICLETINRHSKDILESSRKRIQERNKKQ